MTNAKHFNNYLNMLFVLGLLVVTVVAVPTSVLVQNSEVTSNINSANDNHNMMTKVKRSSNNGNEMMPKSASGDNDSSTANKKSSPEVLPPAFNDPIATQKSSSNVNQINDNTNSNFNSATQLSDNNNPSMPTNEDIITSAIAAGLTVAAVEAAASASQRDLLQQQQQKQQQTEQQQLRQQTLLYEDEETPTLVHKRGISNQQYLYGGMPLDYDNGNSNGNGNGNRGYIAGEYFKNPLSIGGGVGVGLSAVPNGVWTDEMDPSVVYTDVQNDDYFTVPRTSSYRNKAYDNLQNILNAEAYPEALSHPQYANRFYGAINGNKRLNGFDNNNGGVAMSNNNRFADMRLKRDTKLTPADMLALVALVEAGERARKDTDTEPSNNNYMYPMPGMNAAPDSYNNYNGIKTYYANAGNTYDYPNNVDDLDENGGSWLEPNMMDYYGMPMNVEAIPKYDIPREHKYSTSTLGHANGNRYGHKRFMVAKKKRSRGTFLNGPVSKPTISYNSKNEKFY